MAPSKINSGSVQEFDANWSRRKEALYNHWTKSRPQNQIQLAFRRHWILFYELMQKYGYHNCLEVGCGRGSISSYFADNGFECTLLDSSTSVLDTAKTIFSANGHKARFVLGNALGMPFDDNSFDVVVSIGLLEHFEDIQTPIHEQFRVLKPGGMFFGYIVPERPENIQRCFNWLNKILSLLAGLFQKKATGSAEKTMLFRSGYGSERYLPIVEALPVTDIQVMGVYPLPMISHSPGFPFSLLPASVEWVLTRIFEVVLRCRKSLYKSNPWVCDEKTGQAFLMVFRKV